MLPSGRTDQQHPARDAPTDLLEAARVLEEGHDLLHFVLGFLCAGHVIEGDVGVVFFGVELCA